SQGLNLRGLGPSGASRALVLWDGVPVNDPFGGWVYWRALPRLGLERVEVVPGGGSALYGSSALGGVVQLLSRRPEPGTVEADLLGGSRGTGLIAARVSHRHGPLGASLEGEGFASEGYRVVSEAQAGPVDRTAPSRHLSLNGRLDWRAASVLELSARGGLFGENQSGGTTFTRSRVRQAQVALGVHWSPEEAGSLDAQLFVRGGCFRQQRARVDPSRTTEALSAEQDVPASELGLSAAWVARPQQAAGRHALSAGMDVRQVEGRSDEALYPPSIHAESVRARRAQGRQRFGGLWLQDVYAPTPGAEVSAAFRWDAWRNEQGENAVIRENGSEAVERFATRTEGQLSPKLGAWVRAARWLGVRASGYRSFRAPTLNELYRPFQVGTVLTAANAGLAPETLWGGEMGLEFWPRSAVSSRVTGFWNRLNGPIVNVTLPEPSAEGAGRQRQNLGWARVQGVEAEVTGRWKVWSASAAYTWVDPRVVRAPANPALVGKTLAQDPRHRVTVGLTFEAPSLFSATVQARWNGVQFEDDLNSLPMAAFAVVDASVQRRLFRGLELFAAGENLLDRRYLVGRAGVDTVGAPLWIRCGLRLRGSGG
ncbi:MAG TPA: TonB-dependent receptor, partial [Myxococcaceae bacterium]|nr:TonB-dependent receptor [Myxococcaceae bacterium]